MRRHAPPGQFKRNLLDPISQEQNDDVFYHWNENPHSLHCTIFEGGPWHRQLYMKERLLNIAEKALMQTLKNWLAIKWL